MERLFQESVIRKSLSLNGQWSIAYDPGNIGDDVGYSSGEFSQSNVIYVPSCWNFELGRYDYMGVVWYARRFTTAEDVNARLVFHAVSGEAVVYLDGRRLGSHYGSYTKFWFDLQNLPAGEHVLVVKVDNTVNDEDTLPLKFVDWFVWGGIYRGVELLQFGDVSIDRITISHEWNDDTVSRITVRACVKNWTQESMTEEFLLSVNGKQAATIPAKLIPDSTTEIVFEVDAFEPTLWSLEQPTLYVFRVSCDEDDLCDRTGFRKIERKGTTILLNGREIFIKGVNRHNDAPELGYAISPPLILRDMQIIQDLGANAIRGSHYPNDPIVLDYCDQLGLLFWEEIPFWNHPAEALANKLLEKRARLNMREMIERDCNHPSIIIWGIQNESKSSSQAGHSLFGKLAEDIRALDKTRLVSFASACGRDDICFDLVDVVCWNMYPGWYDDDYSLDDLDTRFCESLKDIRAWLEEHGQHKPFIVGEFGAGAILGDASFDQGMRWTENYQAKLLEKAITAIVDSNVVQGFYIWQFCDGRTALPSRISIGRPRNFNNKGLVDEHRKPKLAYHIIKRLLRQIPNYVDHTLEAKADNTSVDNKKETIV